MKSKILLIAILLLKVMYATAQSLYFPPLVGKTWDTLSPVRFAWCAERQDSLFQYLQQTNTKGFILMVDGKIVLEKYFGSFTADSFWYWASAGKTMTAMLTGIAQQKGLLKLSDTSSRYLGKGWTSAPTAKEDKITVWHQLTMTSGLDDSPPVDKNCTIDTCLKYLADAGTRWAYHNAPYTLLDSVIIKATGQSFQAFFNAEMRNKTGINGLWLKSDFNNVLYSNVRSFARFGLLLLNKGKWDQTAILNDTGYFRQMTNSSQGINLSYGYLTWLNGKASFMAPGSQMVFPGHMLPDAPADLYAAMGKNGQILNVIPSRNMVMVRMGDPPSPNVEVPITYNNQIWKYVNKLPCLPSGLTDQQEGASFVLFPNPGQHKIHIELPSAGPFWVSVTDLQGRLLFEGKNIQDVPTEGWESGTYIVELTQSNVVSRQRWIKQ